MIYAGSTPVTDAHNWLDIQPSRREGRFFREREDKIENLYEKIEQCMAKRMTARSLARNSQGFFTIHPTTGRF